MNPSLHTVCVCGMLHRRLIYWFKCHRLWSVTNDHHRSPPPSSLPSHLLIPVRIFRIRTQERCLDKRWCAYTTYLILRQQQKTNWRQLIDRFPDETYGMTGKAKTTEENGKKENECTCENSVHPLVFVVCAPRSVELQSSLFASSFPFDILYHPWHFSHSHDDKTKMMMIGSRARKKRREMENFSLCRQRQKRR